MKLIDLDAKEPYLLDGRYAVGELVRCKDCEYYDKNENEVGIREWCFIHHHGTTAENDFCSWAKMKGDINP